MTRPTMRFVAVKTEDQQAVLMLHKARELLVHQRTMLTNAMRAHMAELGTVTAQGTDGLKALKAHFHATHADMPRHAAAALLALGFCGTRGPRWSARQAAWPPRALWRSLLSR